MKCILNGELMELEKASVPASDLTLRRGYGLFDFFRAHDGIPLYLDEHIRRLFKGINRLRLEVGHDGPSVAAQVLKLIGANQMGGITGIRIVVTGGNSQDGFTPERSNLIITEERFKLPPEEIYQNGTKLMSYEHVREIPEVKSINYLMAVFLAPEMRRKGATEILYYSRDGVSECTRSNIFCIRDGRLFTPQSDILEGITRGKIIDVAQSEMSVSVSDFDLEYLLGADEVFITSTIKRIIPVVDIDGHRIGNGNPGPLTRVLMKKLASNDSAYLDGYKANKFKLNT